MYSPSSSPPRIPYFWLIDSCCVSLFCLFFSLVSFRLCMLKICCRCIFNSWHQVVFFSICTRFVHCTPFLLFVYTIFNAIQSSVMHFYDTFEIFYSIIAYNAVYFKGRWHTENIVCLTDSQKRKKMWKVFAHISRFSIIVVYYLAFLLFSIFLLLLTRTFYALFNRSVLLLYRFYLPRSLSLLHLCCLFCRCCCWSFIEIEQFSFSLDFLLTTRTTYTIWCHQATYYVWGNGFGPATTAPTIPWNIMVLNEDKCIR